ncbi:MAG: glutamine amidotransferase [Candidatus Methylomirabilia bacterium]
MAVADAFSGGTAQLGAAAAVALLAVFATWHYLSLRSRIFAPRALLLTLLRSTAVALVLVLIAGPRVVRQAFNQARRPLAVAIDTSRSMGLLGGLERSRLDRVRDFLETGEFRRVAAGFVPGYFSVADSLVPLARDRIGALQADGARTDLAGMLRGGGSAGEPAAFLLFTDGGHGAAARSEELSALPDVPLVIVAVGAGERPVDAEIASVEPPAIAFAGQAVQIRVVLKASGLAGRSVPLLLKRGEQVLVSQTVVLPPDGQDRLAVLEWTPPAPGGYPLAIHLPVQDGEQIADNNRVELSIEAVRDKIRVLLVTGQPSWSYRFLRGALKGDPSLDVISFIILRTASDAVDVPQQDLSLIPFPTQKIFLEELPNFDLLIFDNFASQPYLPAAYLEKIEEFVRRGGGFWMLGGPLSYLGGRYQQSPISGVLPVTLPGAVPAGGAFRDVPVQPRLTPAGRTHPFFQALADLGGEPPPLRGYNISGPARPGAVVLAEVPVEGGQSQPLVVLGRYGDGRVLSVLTDSLWDWSFGEAGRGRGNRAYLAFVRQAVRWSIGDPQLQPLNIEPERVRIAPGDPIRARIRVLGEDFLPSERTELSVTMRAPGGESRSLVPTLEAPGVYRLEALAAGEGSWEIAVAASVRGAVYARSATTVSAAWPPEEYRAPGVNRAALTALLAGRRGAFLELGGAATTAAALGKALDELTSPGPENRLDTRPLAETIPVFLALLAVLATEWVLRRRTGLD